MPVPTSMAPTTADLQAALAGLTTGAVAPAAPTEAFTTPAAFPAVTPSPVITDLVSQLAPLSPFAALAAADPAAALTALSPSLNIFNPAINPNAAFLAANPAAAPTLALGSVQGPATLPFGKFPWGKFGKLPFTQPFGKI
jgi:hypothetical protein